MRLNPLNLKQVFPENWKGSSGMDSRGHAIFVNQAWAYRAGLRQLARYQAKGHLDSLAKLTARWAPATDTQGSLPGKPQNEPNDYAMFLAKALEIQPDTKLDLFHGKKIRPGREGMVRTLVRAMTIYENGHRFNFDEAAYAEGVRLFEEG